MTNIRFCTASSPELLEEFRAVLLKCWQQSSYDCSEVWPTLWTEVPALHHQPFQERGAGGGQGLLEGDAQPHRAPDLLLR